jgi:alkyldihydroxyacetonephosphate synthase
MSDVISRLVKALSPEKVFQTGAIMDERRHDYWVVSHLRNFQGKPDEQPLVVVRPGHVADVQEVLRIANDTRTPVTPFGLGSGVCGGVLANAETIMLDLSAMNAAMEIDEVNLLATFEAGHNGLAAEDLVAAKGLTIGHFPQSIAVSSVGGWVATRASGQFSTAWGNIEDIVHSIEAVLPNGDVVTLGKAPRASAGPDLRHLMMGSEGTLGVITKVTFSLRRKAELQAFSAFYTKSMADGFQAQREIVQSGWLPPVMRQYDHPEALRNFPDEARDEEGLLILVHEGPAQAVAAEKKAVEAIALGGGLEPGPEAAVAKWMDHRNTVPSWESFFEMNVVVDTIEVSAPWSRIDAVYEAVVAALNEVPGVVNATGHSSHVYRSGINLYFTFGALLEKPEDLEPTYFECWKRVVEATSASGGGIAHHHGIGRVRRDYLELDLGPEGVALLRTVKSALDPSGIMNPGVLLP